MPKPNAPTVDLAFLQRLADGEAAALRACLPEPDKPANAPHRPWPTAPCRGSVPMLETPPSALLDFV